MEQPHEGEPIGEGSRKQFVCREQRRVSKQTLNAKNQLHLSRFEQAKR